MKLSVQRSDCNRIVCWMNRVFLYVFGAQQHGMHNAAWNAFDSNHTNHDAVCTCVYIATKWFFVLSVLLWLQLIFGFCLLSCWRKVFAHKQHSKLLFTTRHSIRSISSSISKLREMFIAVWLVWLFSWKIWNGFDGCAHKIRKIIIILVRNFLFFHIEHCSEVNQMFGKQFQFNMNNWVENS